MKKIYVSMFVILPSLAVSQNFIPVWESSYLPNQESGYYVSSLQVESETLYVGRYSGTEAEILFGDILSEEWIECDVADSLGGILSGVAVDGEFFVYTESGWIVRVNESCETAVLVETAGWIDMYGSGDTLYIYGSSVYIDDTLSPSRIHSFIPSLDEWRSHTTSGSESVVGLTVFQSKLHCVGLDGGLHKIFQLNDSAWNIVYVFPEDEYFVSWESVEDRIYVSSTNYASPFEYGIFSEFKDGDMDSLFASDGNILDISASDCFVTVVGNFTNFGNCDAENLAMFDRSTKEIIQTDRGLDGNGYAIVTSDAIFYVGGAFMYGADIYSPGVISLPSCNEVDIEDISQSQIKIFPNPATDFLSVENGAGKNVRTFSLSEEIYLMANEIDNRKVFDVANLSSGTYYVLIDGEVFPFIKL